LILVRLAGIEPTTLGFGGHSDRSDHQESRDVDPRSEALFELDSQGKTATSISRQIGQIARFTPIT
jgi:hypothetical protein